MVFIDSGKMSPLVTFTPHPDPPPRRGEGRVGVMSLEIFMQRLGKLTLAFLLEWIANNYVNKRFEF